MAERCATGGSSSRHSLTSARSTFPTTIWNNPATLRTANCSSRSDVPPAELSLLHGDSSGSRHGSRRFPQRLLQGGRKKRDSSPSATRYQSPRFATKNGLAGSTQTHSNGRTALVLDQVPTIQEGAWNLPERRSRLREWGRGAKRK